MSNLINNLIINKVCFSSSSKFGSFFLIKDHLAWQTVEELTDLKHILIRSINCEI